MFVFVDVHFLVLFLLFGELVFLLLVLVLTAFVFYIVCFSLLFLNFLFFFLFMFLVVCVAMLFMSGKSLIVSVDLNRFCYYDLFSGLLQSVFSSFNFL